MCSRRFLFALAASLGLHLALLIPGLPQGKVSLRNTAISARLLPPAQVRPNDALLKNTLADDDATNTEPPSRPANAGSRRPPARVLEAAAQSKLSEFLFYPPEAVARGIEGEVRLLLTLDDNGVIRDAQIASGSGHSTLDEAAVKAVFAMGSLPGADAREMILPVVFRLR